MARGNSERMWTFDEYVEEYEKLASQLAAHRWIPVTDDGEMPKEQDKKDLPYPWRSDVVEVTDGEIIDLGFWRTRQGKWDLLSKHDMIITHYRYITLPNGE